MIIVDTDVGTNASEKFYETDDMWFYSPEFDRGFSFSESSHHENILSGCDCEIPSESDIFPMIFSLECDILTFTHVLISICREGSEVFIDGTFSDITSTRIRDFETTEAFEKGRKEEYSNSNFFDLLTVESMDIHCPSIQSELSRWIEFYYHTERFDDGQKCHDISDMWDILEGECLEKKSTRNKGECSIL